MVQILLVMLRIFNSYTIVFAGFIFKFYNDFCLKLVKFNI